MNEAVAKKKKAAPRRQGGREGTEMNSPAIYWKRYWTPTWIE